MELHQLFIDEIRSYNSDELSGLIEALSTAPMVSVRANKLKGVATPDGVNRVKWCTEGWYLPQRIPFTFDPSMHQGLYYVQDASSMIISHIIKNLNNSENTPLRYLDACAAPGGKTTAAIDSLPNGSLVVANEYVPTRAEALSENIIKWGYPSVISQGDTARFKKLKSFFDIIAADVPCSGEGMFRKDAEAVAQWTPSLVAECVARQREIVENLWSALRPGGYFIYSTCTFNRSENEEMVDYIKELGASTIEIEMPNSWNIVKGINTDNHCYRFMPHKVEGEGLFVAVLRKDDDGEMPSQRTSKNKKNTKEKIPNIDQLKSRLIDSSEFEATLVKDKVVMFPKIWSNELSVLLSQLNVIHFGVHVAIVKGKDYIPTQSLAMSQYLNREEFVNFEVDYHTAISYLRREAIVIDDAPRGYVLLTYKNKPLGFVKNLGNRANNLYPQEWRILSTHIPSEIPVVLG